jgi:hypothetical protein
MSLSEYRKRRLLEELATKITGITIDDGRDPGHRKELRVGGTADLEDIHAAQVSETGLVRPQGPGPDSDF